MTNYMQAEQQLYDAFNELKIVQGGKHYVYGETVCHDGTDDKDNSRHCLRDLTLPEISDICKTCQSTNCAVYLVF